MRIVAGREKGHKLTAPRGRGLRPTSDRVKENIFNILGERPKEAKVLDLYAGSGSLGIEALSRGAAETTFVDKNKSAIESIRKNLKATKLEDLAIVYKNDVHNILPGLKAAGKKYNLIFLDPPYKIKAKELKEIFSLLHECLKPGAVVVLEYGQKLTESPNINFQLIDSRHYGDSYVYFYKYE